MLSCNEGLMTFSLDSNPMGDQAVTSIISALGNSHLE